MKKVTGFLSLFILINSIIYAQQGGNIILKKGQKFILENKTSTITSMNMMGQSIETNADVSTLLNMEVKNVKDSGYNLTNTTTRIKMNFTGMGQSQNFDSDKKEDLNGEMGNNLKDINIPHDVLMDRAGRIITVTKEKSDTSNDKASPIEQMMKQFIGDPSETGYGATAAFINIPKKAGVGYTWTDSSSQGGAKKTTTYTISKIEGSDANISITGFVNIEIKTEMQGMEVFAKSSGSTKGNEIVDLSSGIIKEINSTVESTGTVQVMGQDVPMTTKVTTIASVKKL